MSADLMELADRQQTETKERPFDLKAPSITEDEENAARLSPRCIVENYLYADVATLVAAGGTGKTTLMLYEMVHIALGFPLWGNTVQAPGKCLFITAEDSREILVARQKMIKDELKLKPHQDAIVRENLRIMDLSGLGIKLVETQRDISLTGLADAIVDEFKGEKLSLIAFDPLVSFGASERAVNDNEQALIVAARKIKNGLGCCVRYIHHTGQTAARDKMLDQYTGRGGTALSDGARMVTVLQPWSDQMKKPLPNGLTSDDKVIVMATPKLSYGPPPRDMFIHRDGWKFNYHYEAPPIPEADKLVARKEQILRFLNSQLSNNIYHTQRDIEDGYLSEICMTRAQFRKVISQLKSEDRVRNEELPEELRHGRRKNYLKPNAPENQNDMAQ